MSLQAYLSVISEDGERDLFQNDESFPFFWYCFFDKAAFDAVVPEMGKLYEMSTAADGEREFYFSYVEENPGSADILLSKDVFRKNAQAARAYVKGKYPEHATLYDDYIHYIDSEIKDEELLAISLFDQIYAYEDEEDFIGSVGEVLAAIKSADKSFTPELLGDEVFALTGTDKGLGYGFREKSTDYLEACKREEAALAQKMADDMGTNRERGVKYFTSNFVVMILIGGIITYSAYGSYQASGLNMQTVIFLIIGIGALLIGLKGGWEYLQKRMNPAAAEKVEADADTAAATEKADEDVVGVDAVDAGADGVADEDAVDVDVADEDADVADDGAEDVADEDADVDLADEDADIVDDEE